MLTAERQARIVYVITRQGVVTIADLCKRSSVSAATIRRDLQRLEESWPVISTTSRG